MQFIMTVEIDRCRVCDMHTRWFGVHEIFVDIRGLDEIHDIFIGEEIAWA